MKILSAFILSLFSIAAFAMPKVGDMAVYQGTFEGSGGGSMSFEQALTVKALTAAEATVESTVLFDGQERTQEINLKYEELLNSKIIEYLLAKCQDEGGNIETLKVEAGEFQTCAIAQGARAKIWLGHVPFGIVKQIALDEDENVITLELKDYVFGQ